MTILGPYITDEAALFCPGLQSMYVSTHSWQTTQQIYVGMISYYLCNKRYLFE